MDLEKRLDGIEKSFDEEIKNCPDKISLENVKTKYTGRKGELTMILRSLSEVEESKRAEVGKKANTLKSAFLGRIEALALDIEKKSVAEKVEEIDVTLPGTAEKVGTRHPITKTLALINDCFISLGFKIADGPEIETEFYNFEALNIPLNHPSRDAFDTFYIKDKYVLRSHTSNVQIHVMEKEKPPLAVIMPGRVYRPDAVDASHSFMFHQVEGLMVDKGIRFSDLKGILDIFAKTVFGKDIKTRLRPHFFPFTEPSAEVDISCMMCKGKGCRVCSGNGWLEVLGAGMVNPKVFESVEYDPSKYSGFAFGMGVERIAMLLYGIEDIRIFYENDIRFLKQFA